MKTYHDIASDGGSDVIGQVTAQRARLEDRLSLVDHVVAVMSGKGGVGKSTITFVLAEALAERAWCVGIVDADINGPSIAQMTGVRTHVPVLTPGGVMPPENREGIRVMSMDLFLAQEAAPVLWEASTQDEAYTWRPMVEMGALRELIADTEWGPLDVLLVDLPPGADRLPNLASLLPRLSGVVVVTGPTSVSQVAVERSIGMASRVARVPVIGLVENMSAYICPACGAAELLDSNVGDAEALATRHGVPFLGHVPFDRNLALAADTGEPFLERYAGSMAGRAIIDISRKVARFLTR